MPVPGSKPPLSAVPPPCIRTEPSEVGPLLQVLDFSLVASILDPWAGTGGVREAFAAIGCPVYTNDLYVVGADIREDALQPLFYKKLARLGVTL